MRISYEWLGDFVDLQDVTPQRAAEVLTMSGVEVSSVHLLDLSEIVIGRVISQTPHPSSRNPLWIHQVDLGGRTEQVIAGAPNAVPGQLVPVALPGTTVPNGTYVRDAVIAGVAGRGMLCSAAELGLGDDSGGIMLLDRGQPGQSLSELFPIEAILEAEITPNRPDCLCHFGIARELAAALGREGTRDFMPPFTGGIDPAGTELIKVAIDAPDLCRRYIGGVISDVKVGSSPGWLQRRLRAAGLRPINNVVDITNYVLFEYGQPLHAFDLRRLQGPAIHVRRAVEGESLRCLDGVTRPLTGEMLVIADAKVPVALAGVIGGEDTAVGQETTDVLLEAATFNGPNVRATSRALNLRTEASSRFEKTLSPELALAAARRAAALLEEVAGGRVHRDWPDAYPEPQAPVRVRLSPVQIDSVLGVHVPLEEAETILRRLGFHIRVEEEGTWDVLPPVFRLDISIAEDVVEEVGRIHGYEKVPAVLPGSRRRSWQPLVLEAPEDVIRQVLVGAGLTEVVTPALISASSFEKLGLGARMVRVTNPLSDAMDALRSSLLPSLLEVANLNVNRGSKDPALFELGRVFLKAEQAGKSPPEERPTASALALTSSDPEAGRKAFLRIKSILQRAARDASTTGLGFERDSDSLFHPGRCARITADGRSAGHVGEIHPAVLRDLDLDGRAVAFEVDLQTVLGAAGPRRVTPLPRFPAVERDLAVLVDDGVPAADLLVAIEQSAGDLLEAANAFDEYRGSQVEEGHKSLAFSLTFRSSDRTLTDSEVDAAMAAVRSHLQRQHGARIRGTDV